jgi:hypothetical protein
MIEFWKGFLMCAACEVGFVVFVCAVVIAYFGLCVAYTWYRCELYNQKVNHPDIKE